MRRFRTIALALPLVILAACGGAKSTAMPLPSAALPPVIAASAAAGTSVVPVVAVSATAPVAPGPQRASSPTPLATSAVASTAQATPAPTKAPPVASATAPPRASQAAAPPAASSAKTARVTDIPSAAPQQMIGTASDGLTLLNVRTGKDDGFTRLVFDLSRQDGSAAPVPRTRLWVQDGTIIVAFGGVRDDVYAASLGSEEERVNLGMVQSVYRIPVRDDASAAYGIAVTGSTRVTLSATTLPTRVIVDVADK
jgi:hypothetical protein